MPLRRIHYLLLASNQWSFSHQIDVIHRAISTMQWNNATIKRIKRIKPKQIRTWYHWLNCSNWHCRLHSYSGRFKIRTFWFCWMRPHLRFVAIVYCIQFQFIWQNPNFSYIQIIANLTEKLLKKFQAIWRWFVFNLMINYFGSTAGNSMKQKFDFCH